MCASTSHERELLPSPQQPGVAAAPTSAPSAAPSPSPTAAPTPAPSASLPAAPPPAAPCLAPHYSASPHASLLYLSPA